ncbi:MAG: tRNA (guanosine(46)-N7)-methyltransferase TrmB [Anaerolineales bacterium]|nr:tRNA (guanosine(46)-N7)-methyltransferase TrmB [Anaerolineales bacterium]MCB8991079.1 tRNA (guanosine(46)-N7)-methyltransferase TrmB [Ardenticatenaceae bacterium]MCB9004121.1 tRNA (guanosine(46)-N7)-methyltransferase TrmB [Ardenticatenaceae bacterium]
MLRCNQMPWPVDWAQLFEREAPLHVEVGFGGGQFLLALARERPSMNLVGLEISLPSLRKTAHKLERAQLPNVRLIQGGVETFLWALCPLGALAGIYINFPDPWPKAAHHHRRVINPRFLHLAATRMMPGAVLEIATDHAEYAEVITEVLADTPYFVSRQPTPFVTEDHERVRTKYELKALAEGRTCYYFKWQRNDVPAPDNFPIPEEVEMPHVVLRSPLTLDEMSARFEPHYLAADEGEIKFIELFQSSHDGKLLVDVYVHEAALSQRVCLTLRSRRSGDVVIGLHEVGFPRPTVGIHRAVRALADWIVSLHSEAAIVNSTVHPVIGEQ